MVHHFTFTALINLPSNAELHICCESPESMLPIQCRVVSLNPCEGELPEGGPSQHVPLHQLCSRQRPLAPPCVPLGSHWPLWLSPSPSGWHLCSQWALRQDRRKEGRGDLEEGRRIAPFLRHKRLTVRPPESSRRLRRSQRGQCQMGGCLRMLGRQRQQEW